MRRRVQTCDPRYRRHLSEHLTMRRSILLACALGVWVTLLAPDGFTHNVDRDCSDFDTQRAAQDHRDTHASDPDRLDDENGLTCPELPCPCGATVLPPPTPVPLRTAPTAPRDLPLTEGRVAAVIDAATLRVGLPHGETVDVRLIGIDAVKRRACAGVDATAHMKRLAFRNGIGRLVKLKSDPTQDREDHSGRRLAYVSAQDVDFGRALVWSGRAVNALDSHFLRAGIYRRAQSSAKAAERGVWRRCGPRTTG